MSTCDSRMRPPRQQLLQCDAAVGLVVLGWIEGAAEAAFWELIHHGACWRRWCNLCVCALTVWSVKVERMITAMWSMNSVVSVVAQTCCLTRYSAVLNCIMQPCLASILTCKLYQYKLLCSGSLCHNVSKKEGAVWTVIGVYFLDTIEAAVLFVVKEIFQWRHYSLLLNCVLLRYCLFNWSSYWLTNTCKAHTVLLSSMVG